MVDLELTLSNRKDNMVSYNDKYKKTNYYNMKKLSVLLGIFLIFGASGVWAQKQAAVINIQTSAQCEMCKEAIEEAFAFEKGVVSSELNEETKIVEVKYKEKKTSPEKLRLSLSKIGYDADDVKADEKAYMKLPTCCKKPGDR